MPPKEYNATVAQRIDVAPGLMILRVVPDQLPFSFQAGQYTVLGLKRSVPTVQERGGEGLVPASTTSPNASAPAGTEGATPAVSPNDENRDALILRAYSVASSSLSDEYVEFYLALVPSGELTPRLFSLRVRDRLYLGPKATGMFTLGKVPSDRHIYLVGTGTGLAPYMSMLRSEIQCGGPQKVFVLHGARVSWDLAYRTELQTLARLCSNIFYFPVVSQPEDDPTWRGRCGFLQDVLLAGEVEAKTGVPVRPDFAHVFLCGNPLMIEATKARLTEERGYVPDRKKEIGTVHLEEYW